MNVTKTKRVVKIRQSLSFSLPDDPDGNTNTGAISTINAAQIESIRRGLAQALGVPIERIIITGISSTGSRRRRLKRGYANAVSKRMMARESGGFDWYSRRLTRYRKLETSISLSIDFEIVVEIEVEVVEKENSTRFIPTNFDQLNALNDIKTKLDSMAEATSGGSFTTTAAPSVNGTGAINTGVLTFGIFDSILKTLAEVTGHNASELLVNKVEPKEIDEAIEVEVVEIVLPPTTTTATPTTPAPTTGPPTTPTPITPPTVPSPTTATPAEPSPASDATTPSSDDMSDTGS
jgi:hypothetical protein